MSSNDYPGSSVGRRSSSNRGLRPAGRGATYLCLILWVGCVTLWRSDSLPKDYQELSLKELVALVGDHGVIVIRKVYQHLRQNGQLVEAGRYIFRQIDQQRELYETVSLINVLHLYQLTGDQQAHRLFVKLLTEKRRAIIELAWQIATIMPSPAMARAIAGAISEAVEEGREKSLFLPQVASAVTANRVKGVYTLLRAGLNYTHHESFAQAMLTSDPKRATTDFTAYLSRASIDELRQQSPTSVDVYVCMVILRHLERQTLSPHDRNFAVLFWYAISRNPGLSELASRILEGYYGKHAASLAQMLARLPYWAQFAFVGNIGRRLTPASRQFLVVLQQKTSGVDVIDEINQVIR